jgi:hypothetical protein
VLIGCLGLGSGEGSRSPSTHNAYDNEKRSHLYRLYAATRRCATAACDAIDAGSAIRSGLEGLRCGKNTERIVKTLGL